MAEFLEHLVEAEGRTLATARTYLAAIGVSRAARRCTTAAEESCATRTMRKNRIGSRAGSGQEQGSAGPE